MLRVLKFHDNKNNVDKDAKSLQDDSIDRVLKCLLMYNQNLVLAFFNQAVTLLDSESSVSARLKILSGTLQAVF